MSGTITFKPIEAKLTRSTEFIGKMDPYCFFILGDYRVRGQICKKGGKHPKWSESVTIPRIKQTICQVEVKDDDVFDDVKIGSCQIDLQEVEIKGSLKKWYPIFYKDKSAGELLMEVIFTVDEKHKDEVKEKDSASKDVSTSSSLTDDPNNPKIFELDDIVLNTTVQSENLYLSSDSLSDDYYAIEALMNGVNPKRISKQAEWDEKIQNNCGSNERYNQVNKKYIVNPATYI